MGKSSEIAGLRGGKVTDKVTDTAVGEAAHLAGSAVLTAGVAAALVLVAIPASIGLGIVSAVKSIRKRR
jgi:hypothetical protein